MGYDYVELESKIVTARKHHFCSWCGEKVSKGSKIVSTSFIFDDALQRDWMHLECTEAHKRLDWNDYPDGFMLGQFVRGETYVPGDVPV